MSLTPGARLGPYEIQSAIGAGGMGEVYKAKDTRLDRSVAIKVLPREVSADPDRRRRFEREAKTIAGLNHPHICSLFDVGEAVPTGPQPLAPDPSSVSFLVMEHLTGETLAQRLERGPLPLEQALTVATEIADALSAAHRQGVIHRDLKPGNIMLTKTGTKLLDFGLAKLKAHGERPAAAHLASAPTQSTPLTGEGMIVGTLPYMAPEQVEGRGADARTDLWALGAMLYEMLTGKRAFAGTSAASLIGHIMNSEPPALATLQPLTPPALDRLVKQCLAKAPDDRPDTAHDVANELRWLRDASSVGAVPAGRPRRRGVVRATLIVAGALGMAIVGAGMMWWLRPASPTTSMVHSALPVTPAEELNAGGFASTFLPTLGGSRTAVTWTPDGQALIFVGRRAGVQQLYMRRLDAEEARALPNTDGAQVPALSPDGQWVAFWTGTTIKKVPLAGGPVVDLATGINSPPRGLVWDDHGGLFFGAGDGRIWTIPAEGKPEAVTTVGEGEVTHMLPSLLPRGHVLLYTVRKRELSWGDEEVVAQPLPTGERKVLLTDATDARYVATGHLVFLRRGTLWAVPFDAERLEKRGREAPVRDRVVQALTGGHTNNVTGAGQFAVSAGGTLAYLSGPVVDYQRTRLVTVDRHGAVTPLPGAPEHSYTWTIRLSPDQRHLAVVLQTLTGSNLWVHDLTRPAPPLRLPSEGEVCWSAWARSGQELIFYWLKDGRVALARQPADGTAEPKPLAMQALNAVSVGPDGRLVAVAAGDLLTVTVENGTVRVENLTQTPDITEQWPEVSPDGHWLVYGSNQSRRDEVYVRPYPGPGAPTPVSVEGGTDPAWHPTSGREIFFVSPADPSGRQRMMVVTFTPGSPPVIGRPTELFSFDPRDLRMACMPGRCHDVAADGQRFYARQAVPTPPGPPVTHINLIQNWFEELRAKGPLE